MASMNRYRLTALAIIALSYILGIYFYPQMPDQIASHWDSQGAVNGYTPKLWGLFLFPSLILVLFGFFILIPRIDPLKRNIAQFIKYFDGFILMFTAFMFYLYLLTILFNLGYKFDFNQALTPAFGFFVYYLGVLMANAKRNWFIGIRTPWTLSSDAVWDNTHRLGSKLFKLAGVISFLGIFFPAYSIFFIVVPLLAVAAYTFVYSYFEYQKQEGGKKKAGY